MLHMKLLAALILVLGFVAPGAAQNKPDLFPRTEIRPQTDSERLQNFKPPSPPPTTYPNISRDERGEPRLNINRDVSVGGNVTRDSVEGNVRFPIPDRR